MIPYRACLTSPRNCFATYYGCWPPSGAAGAPPARSRKLTSRGQAVLALRWFRDRTPAVQLINRTNPADLLVVGAMESMPSVPAWHRGKMVLVGDSAHAPSSSSGQGASLALESAVELARCLRDHPAAEDAFAVYEAMRRPRAERIAKEATRKNNTKTVGPVGRVLMGAAIRMFARLSNPEKAAWMLHYKIDWDALATPATATARPTSATQPVA